MKFWLIGLMLSCGTVQSAPLYQDARATLETQPALTWSRFQQIKPELSLLPAWLQRDWYLLAAQAQLRLKNWTLVAELLQQADLSLTTGLSAAEIALTAGTLSYQRQRYADAWFWFQCTDSFDNPPETASKIALNLGVLAGLQQDPAKSRQYYLHGLQLAESHQFLHLTPMFYNNLGLLSWRQGEMAQAEHYLRLAIYGHSRNSGAESQARSILNLLVVLVAQKKWPQFSRYLAKAESLVSQQQNPDYPVLLLMLRNLSELASEPARAQVVLQQAAQIRSQSLRISVSLLLSGFDIHWQAGLLSPPADGVELELVQTAARCPQISLPTL